ncbi:MAG: trimethylamine methyltransferase family protein, partial [Pseudomonadota bacterium]
VLAADRVVSLLANYTPPPLDPGTAEALNAFVAERKAAEPDAFT